MTIDSQAAPWQLPTPFRSIVALVLLGTMLIGVWEVVAATRKVGAADFPHTLMDFREGRTTITLEKQLEKNLPSRKDLIAFANTVRYILTGGGGDQVRVGKDGWLFLTEELRFDAGGGANLSARADLLAAASRKLDTMGVKLVVVLVPDKARIHVGKLASAEYPAYNRSRYQDAFKAIQSRNVAVIDLLEPMSKAAEKSDVYYRTDTHWNQAGAEMAAQAVASMVRKLGVNLKPTVFETSPGGEAVKRPGDLLRLMGLEDIPDAMRPAADNEVPMVTTEKSDGSAGGLFGDAGVSVVLTGTSYSLRGNFHGYLQQGLQTKVLNAAKDGGGFLQATTAYLKDESFQSAKPDVLVWEIPERFMLAALDGEPTWLAKAGLLP